MSRCPCERRMSSMPVEDLVLKGWTEALWLLQPVLPARRFEFIDAGDPELAVEVEYFLRAQDRDGQQFQDARLAPRPAWPPGAA